MTDIYIPKGSVSLDKITEQQIRLGIQGPPGEGKTWAAMTFPNVIVPNFDRGLGAHHGRPDIIEVPFYNPAFVDSIVKRKPGDPPNKRDAFEKWLMDEGNKLSSSQTLVVDAGTGVESAFEQQENLEPVITNKGEVDKLAFWRHKIEYFDRIFDIVFGLKCHVIWVSHEQAERNSKGDLSGKNKPLFSGQYADKVVSKFTDWFRQHASDKPKDLNNPDYKPKPETLAAFNMTHKEWVDFCKSFPRGTIYYWQTESDDIFNGKCSSLINFPRFIPASYESFKKYRRKIV